MRVALLTNILTPYRLPVYRDLAATPGWHMRFLLSAESDPLWERAFAGAHAAGRDALDVEVPSGFALRTGRGRTTLHVPTGALAALRRFAPDVVVSAELGPRSALAALHAATHRTPLVLWSYHARAAAERVNALRNAWRRALLARADAVVGMGRQAREVLLGLGVPDAKLFDAPNAHAAGWWEERFARVDPAVVRAALHASTGARERIALVAGRLDAGKGVRELLDAWRALGADARRDWTLLFVGDGPLAGAVARASGALEPGAVVRLPAVRPEDLAELYAASERLVFASLGDPWGLVVNEAMAAGLPVVCSRRAGCADELVTPGETGWLFDPSDANDFRATLAAALADPDATRLGARARDRAKRFGPEQQAAGLRRAIQFAAARRVP